MADYSVDELRQVLLDVGLAKGDTVYCHSNIGFFGVPEGGIQRQAVCAMFLEQIQHCIGPNGTLIVPTYTYSFSNGQSFDPAHTPSKMGVFAEWVRQLPASIRSHDPFFSVAALGRDAEKYCCNLPPNSFAPDSTFGRFMQTNGKILCLNHPGCTLLHFIERELRVPYRFDKCFDGDFVLDGHTQHLTWEIFVRYMSDDLLAHSPQAFVKTIKDRNIARWQNLGRGECLALSAQAVREVVVSGLRNDPWFLTAASGTGATPKIDPLRR